MEIKMYFEYLVSSSELKLASPMRISVYDHLNQEKMVRLILLIHKSLTCK